MKTDTTAFNQGSPKHEYSPNNNTNQNIEQYNKNKLLLNQFNFIPQEPSQYSNIGYIPGASYQMLPNYNVKNSQYFFQHPEYFSPPNNNQNYLNKINNNLIIKDNSGQNYINQELVKNLNNDNNGYSNPNDNNNNNNSINVKNNKEEEKDKNVVEDPDEFLFREQDNKNDKNSQKDESESELSPDSDKNSDNEKDFNDHLLAQYEKVKRVKNKWKVNLIGCVVQQDNKEYICGKIHGELEREW
jgi:hypothetical protein